MATPMTKLQIAFGVVTIALLSAVIFIQLGSTRVFGAVNNSNCGGSVTCFTDLSIGNFWSTGIAAYGPGTTAATEVQEQVLVGTCATGTSTPFDIANPFTSTSTATIENLDVVGQATSTDISIGTTTKSSGLAVTDVSPNLVRAATIATGTEATIISGLTTGLGSGQVSAGTGSQTRIVVGPTERIGAFATSTFGTTGAINYSPAITSCTYKIRFRT